MKTQPAPGVAVFCLAYFPIRAEGAIGQAAFRPAKQNQINPRKTKEKGLDFLGFLWPNWDFSKGYGESK
jgi:hypothetical protein